jgi:bla regulator protein blaR1
MNVLAATLSSWTLFGSALGNHLWQSTVFAAVAALLTLLLRKNHARTRYWLWFAASLKFLLPFALLISVGSYLQPKQAPAQQSQVSIVMDQITQPFAPAGALDAPVILPRTAPRLAMRVLPLAALTIWCIGFAALLIFWSVRWRRITRAICESKPLESGREVEMLRSLERNVGLAHGTRLVSGSAALEPGVVGIIRPVMFLPAGIAERLSDSQLSAVMMHELCHLRRRDNLAAVLHMLVESVFWFHPLVWWMGARLIDERERACDEEVLALGSEPQAYAEGILKVCEFYLETPLVCVAGITGSNLKKRIEAIMIHRIARKLELGKKILLATIAAAALIAPVVFGLFHPAQSLAQSAESTTASAPGFESVFIQPNINGKAMPPFNIVAGPDENFVGFKFGNAEFRATHATLPQIIRMAYGVLDFQITGGPDWLSREKYDVAAKFLNGMNDGKFWSLPQDEQSSRMDQRRLELQALLADRFKLVVHRETRQLPIYSLAIAANGPKLHEASPGDAYADGMKRRDGVPMGAGLWVPQAGVILGQGISTKMLAAHLSQQLGRMIVDNTGLTGKYDFKLQWAPDKDESASLFSAMPEQLGLQLTPQAGPVEMVVIDRAEPAETVAGTTNLLKPVSAQEQSQAGSGSPFAFGSVSITPKGLVDPKAIVRTRISQHNGNAEFENQSLKTLLRVAFGVDGSQILGPDWISSNLYDMTLTAGKQLHGNEFKQEFQQLLVDRFKLAFHRELRPLPAYELVIGSSGSKLAEEAPGTDRGNHFNADNGRVTATRVTMEQLVDFLQPQLGRPIVDKTGLNGTYDFAMTVENWQKTRKLSNGNDPQIDSLMRAVSEQLGLELKPATDPVEVIVIDRAEPVTSQETETAAARN